MATDLAPPGDRFSAVETALEGFSTAEKLELVERIVRSIRSEPPRTETDDEIAERQYQARLKLLEKIKKLPEVPNEDSFSNRDHDKVLYGSP